LEPANNKWHISETVLHQKINKAWNDLLKDNPLTRPTSSPVAYLLGGQPGAGKSSLREEIVDRRLKGNALFIAVDDFRAYHPDFVKIYKAHKENSAIYTHDFASGVADAIIDRAIGYNYKNEKYNVVIESTFKTYANVEKKIQSLEKQGYERNVLIATCPADFSYFSVIDRLEQSKSKNEILRAVATEIHNDVVKTLAANVQKIYENYDFKRFEIRNRGNELWSNSDDKYKGIKPLAAIERELDRHLNEAEIYYVREQAAGYSKGAIQSLEKTCSILEKELNKIKNSLLEVVNESNNLSYEHGAKKIVERSKGFLGRFDEKKLEGEIDKAIKAQTNLIGEVLAQTKNLFSIIDSSSLLTQKIRDLAPAKTLETKAKSKDRSRDDFGL
jgi:hypothetical protein